MSAPDALPPSPPRSAADAPYVYAATDIRPRQPREIDLCNDASHFDWQYTGAFVLGFAASVYLDINPLKGSGEPGIRLIGPGLVGFTFGGMLSGGFLSLPKCDPLWSEGPPPEGNVRTVWPIAVGIAVISGIMGPIMDYTFLGPVKLQWAVSERAARVFVGSVSGIVGSLFPYILPPRTWAARREIDRMHVIGTPGGAAMTYTLAF